MHFIIVHGSGCDEEAAEVIYQRLNQKGISAEILTDEESLKDGRRSDGFVISVGGKLVNVVSGRIQEIYSRALDVSNFEMMKSFCYCWGSKDGVRTNAYHLNCGCLALWGPAAEDTLKSSEDFVLDGALLDNIIHNYNSWTKKAKLIPI